MIAISIFTAKILLFVLGCACLVGVALIGYVKEVSDFDPCNVGSEE